MQVDMCTTCYYYTSPQHLPQVPIAVAHASV